MKVAFVVIALILALSVVGCNSVDRVGNAESYLRSALSQLNDVQEAIRDGEYVGDLDFQLGEIGQSIEDALQELYYTHPR